MSRISNKTIQVDFNGLPLLSLEDILKKEHVYSGAFTTYRFIMFKKIAHEKLGETCRRLFLSLEDFDKIIETSVYKGEEFWFDHLGYVVKKENINLSEEYLIFRIDGGGRGIFNISLENPGN